MVSFISDCHTASGTIGLMSDRLELNSIGPFQMKRYQVLENRAAALRRETDIQRASVRQLKDKLQQMHELLASREQEHR